MAAVVAEAAVVGSDDELLGQAITGFVSLKESAFSGTDSTKVRELLIQQVRRAIGPFSAPKQIYLVSDLPKTRSGKIMRRLLRKMLQGDLIENLGDTSTVSFVYQNFPLFPNFEMISANTSSEAFQPRLLKHLV
jgi:acetyl-CoA synthetase